MRGRNRLLAAIAGVVVVLLLTFLFLVSPKRGDLNDLRAEKDQEESRTLELTAELTRLQALEENSADLEAQVAKLRQTIPKGHQMPNFIFQVQEAANKSGVGFLQITNELPKTPPEGAALAQVRVTIGANGGYFAIQDFVRRLYNLDRALRADVLTMQGAIRADGSPQISLSMTARIFFEIPEGVVPTVGGVAPAETPASETTEAPADGTEE